MASITFKCPNCGGGMIFDPNTSNFICEFCDSQFDEATLISLSEKKKKEADKKEEKSEFDENGAIYICESCGAQIVTDETTAATYCYYCHNPVVLSGRLTKEFKPDLVVPFSIDKKKAIDTFLKWTSGKRYVPKNFFSKEQIEKVSGVYYPYWMAEYNVDGTFKGEGETVNIISNKDEDIITTQHYDVYRSGNIEFREIMRSALEKNDRKLADGVMPFNLGDAREFQMGYLSGFMAEKRDIEPNSLEQGLEKELENYIQPILTEDCNYSSLSGKSSINVNSRLFKYLLLPTWVLTYKGADNKMYYYSMNGQTGTTCGILPTDKKKMLIDSFIIGAITAILLMLGGFFIW